TALVPFTLRWPAAEFSWIPFAGQLEGAMLTNLTALIERLFLYAGILWLISLSGRGIWAGAICLAAFALLLEAAQMFVAGRTPDITEVIWVLLTVAALHAVGRAAR
ncbi:MAG: VanZ family protein, partial [Burkholderiales bacterium]